MVVLDTSIIIDHLRLREKYKESWLVKLVRRYQEETFAVPAVVVSELYVGKSTLIPEKEKDLISLLSSFKIISINYEVAKLAGELVRDCKVKTALLTDALVAACAIYYQAQLATLNLKHFQIFNEVKLVSLS